MKKQTKPKNRRSNQLRSMKITRNFIECAHGAVLIQMGRTRVLCCASLVAELPRWRQEAELGWVTAEYSMLPASTSPRKPRSRAGHTDGRGTEIQRLVGRVLRSVVDFKKLGPNTIYLDCDVLQADGGTRTAAINGSFVALMDAVRYGIKQGVISENPVTNMVGAVSVGMVKGKPVLDLDYQLDSQAQVDMNIAMTEDGRFIEVQGTAEQEPFTNDQLDKMLSLARSGIKIIIKEQKKCLKI